MPFIVKPPPLFIKQELKSQRNDSTGGGSENKFKKEVGRTKYEWS